jgi:hypothetical protein
MTFKRAFKRCFCDESGKLTIIQFPNLSGALTVVFLILHIQVLAAVAGLWWSYLEIRYGVNYFRRGLGVFVAVVIIRGLIRSL